MERAMQDAFEAVILTDVVPATGCTEPIAIALAAAKARALLGARPERLVLRCSGNVIKNARSVQVPRSGGRPGIEIAGAMGVVCADETLDLRCLEPTTPEQAEAAAAWVSEGRVSVILAQGIPGLYIEATCKSGDESATVVVQGGHTHVAETRRNGEVLSQDPWSEGEKTPAEPEGLFSMEHILTFADEVDLAARPRLVDVLDRQLADNEAISQEGLKGGWGAEIGRTLLETRGDDVHVRARALAAAGSDARMSGCAQPVMINSGSGNQGITVSMPVLVYARELGASHDELLRALLVSNLVAIHQKRLIGRLSAFCGAVSAAAGSAAGIARLKGLSHEAIGAAVTNTVATSGGIMCDGAKSSCAAKISVAVENATSGVDMAARGKTFSCGDGIVGATVEETIKNVGRIAHDGMAETDVEILSVMLEQPKG